MGFIKLDRKITEWEWYKDPATKDVFIHLLLMAEYEDRSFRGTTIKRGQLFTSVREISVETGLSEKRVRSALDKLETTKEIARKGQTKGTLITIEKYTLYQGSENEKGEQREVKRGEREGKPTYYIRNKEIKNTKEKEIKEKEKRYGTFGNVRLSDEEYQKAKEKYPDLADEMIEQLSEYMASKGKHYKSHYATILAWCRKRKDGRNDFVGGNGRSVQGTTETPGAEKDYDKW